VDHAQGRIFRWLLAASAAFLAGAIAYALWQSRQSAIPADERQQVALGRRIYERHCASCHGARLEGQPGWRNRLPSGRMPAPPHDDSGHTWHHPDAVLFGITKEGLVPGKYAPPGYQSDMPAFGGVLSDAEIGAVLAYIKNTWSQQARDYQRQVDGEFRARAN
jgi:mono/diheme cytochrome c family protein